MSDVTASLAAFDAQRRSTLAGLADAMIPAAEGMPSASQAGVAETFLDSVLEERPDLAAPLLAIVATAAGRDPGAVVADLQANDPATFGVLAEFVPNAYFMNPEVRTLVGYPGQVGLDVDETWPPDWLDLLEPVIDRGPIYRIPPDGR
jgi:hypothetical protein